MVTKDESKRCTLWAEDKFDSSDNLLHEHEAEEDFAFFFNEAEEDFAFFFRTIKDAASQEMKREYNPSSLIADNAGAITNGYMSVFQLVKRVNCWAHMIRNIDKRLKSIKKGTREAIRADLMSIQLSTSETIFKKSIQLFRRKYATETDFQEYMLNTWINTNSNW